MTAREKKKRNNVITNRDKMTRLRKADHAKDSRKETKKKNVG